MSIELTENGSSSATQTPLARRSFLRNAGVFTLGAAAALGLGASGKAGAQANESTAEQDQDAAQAKDTVAEIFTAALIAEDLATTFYYNMLAGPIVTHPNLSGPGGTAKNVSANGNIGNVFYIRTALTEEISHGTLLRSLLGIADFTKDPVKTFYFPAKAFSDFTTCIGLLEALENAFISAYLNAIQELAKLAAQAGSGSIQGYTAKNLAYFAKVSASILGVEAEHRALGRVIGNYNPANNVLYEQGVGINAVYNGPSSAVVALTPFLTSSTGPGYSFESAIANQASVSLGIGGGAARF